MESRTEQVANLDDEIRDIRKRMRRFIETGDLKRLIRLRVRLDQLQANLEILKKKEAARLAPKFRRSYGFEAWCDALAIGRKTSKPFYHLKDDLKIV
jgi:hypothetical protein